jgi:hypothetical protein
LIQLYFSSHLAFLFSSHFLFSGFKAFFLIIPLSPIYNFVFFIFLIFSFVHFFIST